MYYNKGAAYLKPKRRVRLAISTFEGINTTLDEELVPFKYSPKSYNYRMSGGILQQGNGFSLCNFCEECVNQTRAVFEYRRYDRDEQRRDDRIVIVAVDGAVRQYKALDGSVSLMQNLYVEGLLSAENYRYKGKDVLLLSSSLCGLFIIDGDSYYKVENSPEITSMCLHYDRMYCTVGGEKNAVWFSDDFDPSNWNVSLDEAGYIEFNDDLGSVNAVVSFLDRVYIFRDYGINKLSAYNDQGNFSVARLYLSTGRIVADTVKCSGSGIIFQADNAVYHFDGLEVRRIMTNLTGLLGAHEYSNAAFFNGCYYLACNIKADSPSERNNGLIEYRMYDGDINVMHGFDISCMTAINQPESKLLAVVNGNIAVLDASGALFGQPLRKLWTTPESTLGLTDTVKILKEIVINSKHDAILDVELDGVLHRYYLDGDSKYQKVKVNESFDRIRISVISETTEARISRIELIIDMR